MQGERKKILIDFTYIREFKWKRMQVYLWYIITIILCSITSNSRHPSFRWSLRTVDRSNRRSVTNFSICVGVCLHVFVGYPHVRHFAAAFFLLLSLFVFNHFGSIIRLLLRVNVVVVFVRSLVQFHLLCLSLCLSPYSSPFSGFV